MGRWLSPEKLMVFLDLCQKILNFMGLSVRRLCDRQSDEGE